MSTKNRYAVDGKVVIVTGAGSGMGREIARGFLDNGARVVVAGRRADRLAETIDGYSADQTIAVPTDVGVRADVAALVARTVGAFGRLDVVVNNAGVVVGGPLSEVSDEEWRACYATNVDALFYLATEAESYLKETTGSLIAISSVSGVAGDWGQAAYNSSKHAVMGLVRSLALDWGESGVRVNAVAPAFTLTDMTKGIWGDDADLSAFTNRIALGRPGRASDVVGPVLFLASDDSAYMTGSVVTVDGGTSASTGQPHT